MWTRTGKGAALAIALALPALAAAKGDVEFFATVDQDEVALDQTVTLTLTMQSESTPERLVTPDEGIRDFDVVSRMHSDQMSFAFGGSGGPVTRHSRVYTFVLKPLHEGTCRIPMASARIGGKLYTTSPIDVHVTAAGGGQPKTPPPTAQQNPFFPGFPQGLDDDSDQDPFSAIIGQLQGESRPPGEQDLFVRVALDKKTAYLGEQIDMTVLLMSRYDISGVEGFNLPKLDGFWAEDLDSPTQINAEIKYLDGIPYRVYMLKKRAIFPTRSGKLVVDPVEVDVQTGFGLLFNGRRVHRESQPIAIQVKPLPRDGVPPGFDSVNVGQYDLTAGVSDQSVPAGQPVTFRLVASGRGNIRSITLPRVPALANAKVFDPTTSEKVAPDKNHFGGTKTVETVIVPERTGELTIPALEWPVFDPVTKQYEVKRTRPVTVRVTAGAAAASSTGAATGGTNVLSEGLRPLRRGLDTVAAPPWHSRLFLPLLGLPVLFFFGLALGERIRDVARSGEGERRIRRAGSRARRRLSGARKLLGEKKPTEFYAEVARALEGYAADKLRRPVAGLTRDALSRTLRDAGAHPPAVKALVDCLDACDVGRFAPGGSARMHEVVEGAQRAMELLEEAEWKAPSEAA